MKVIFLGTRGYIKPKSTRHRMHTSTIVAYRRRKVMIDCGESWLGKFSRLMPSAIVITHSHPDHAFGLKEASPCPVYATAEAWKMMKSFPIRKQFRNVLEPRRPQRIAGITFEAFPVAHSIIAPAVGYRISAGKVVLFYVPDVARIADRSRALSGIRAYIGDGATITRSLLRHQRRSGQLIGHASIETQLGWCKKEGVPKMIVTHCGSTTFSKTWRANTAYRFKSRMTGWRSSYESKLLTEARRLAEQRIWPRFFCSLLHFSRWRKIFPWLVKIAKMNLAWINLRHR